MTSENGMSGADRGQTGTRGTASPHSGGSWARLQRDFDRLRAVKGRGFWRALADALLFDSGFQALLAYRCGSALRRAGVPLLPAVFRRWAIGACAVDILPTAELGGGCIVAHGIGLVIGGATVIGEDCTLLHGVTLGEVRFDELACPRLGDRVTVGAGAIVLGGITVGDDALIGAGAVVRDDVPAGAAVAGVPARVIGRAGSAAGVAPEAAAASTAARPPERDLQASPEDPFPIPRRPRLRGRALMSPPHSTLRTDPRHRPGQLGSPPPLGAFRTSPFDRFRAGLVAAVLCVAVPGLGASAAAAPAAGSFQCSSDTVLTLFGVDTLHGHLLLRTVGGWLLETAPAAGDAGGGDWTESALYYREPDDPRAYGGSMGAGPILAVTRCGGGCLQAVTWGAGRWQPLGEPLTGAPSGIAYTTYDGAGVPWLVLQHPLEPGEGPDDGVRAHAWRLVDGRWADAGAAVARSSGASAAVAAPDRNDAILSGTVRFAIGEKPQSWLASLPSLPARDVGVLVPAEDGAAYLTADGHLLLSRDGEHWVRSRWTPWGQHPTRLWAPGRDYTVDLPTGDRHGALHAVWIDRREGESGRLYLTTWQPRGEWKTLVGLHPEISTLNGERLGYSEIVVAGPGTWVLLSGCVNTANGPGLVLRTFGPDGLTRPRFLPLRPAVVPGGSGRQQVAP